MELDRALLCHRVLCLRLWPALKRLRNNEAFREASRKDLSFSKATSLIEQSFASLISYLQLKRFCGFAFKLSLSSYSAVFAGK